MNKLYLDKLCDFINNSYNNYSNYDTKNTKNFDFDEIVNIYKQNNSLNEKGLLLKHEFVELKTLVPTIKYDNMVLINPLCFNLYGNLEWFNLLNAILTVTNDNYLHENNFKKKKIIEKANEILTKKININNTLDNILSENNTLNDNIINLVAISINVVLIIVSDCVKSYNKNNKNKTEKFIVFYKKKIIISLLSIGV